VTINGRTVTLLVQVIDTITDLTVSAPPIVGSIGDNTLAPGGRDYLDLSGVLDRRTDFAGDTAFAALAQGYIVLKQAGTAGEPGYGTRVLVDANGAAEPGGEMAVAFLENVSAPSLSGFNFIV
jgi:hypothetical protein